MHSIKQRLQQNQTVRVMSLGALAHPKLVEAVAQHGKLHGFWIDQEHSAVTHQQMEMILMACRATGLDAFARVPPTDYVTVMRPMEAGCSGIMAARSAPSSKSGRSSNGPSIRHWEHAACSWATRNAVMEKWMPGNMSPWRIDDRWIAIQIETVESVERIDEIAAVDGGRSSVCRARRFSVYAWSAGTAPASEVHRRSGKDRVRGEASREVLGNPLA